MRRRELIAFIVGVVLAMVSFFVSSDWLVVSVYENAASFICWTLAMLLIGFSIGDFVFHRAQLRAAKKERYGNISWDRPFWK